MAWPSAVSAGTRKACGSAQLAHGVGGDRAHALRRDVADALAEARQAFERALAHCRRTGRPCRPGLRPGARSRAGGRRCAAGRACSAPPPCGSCWSPGRPRPAGRRLGAAGRSDVAARMRGIALIRRCFASRRSACAECGASPSPRRDAAVAAVGVQLPGVAGCRRGSSRSASLYTRCGQLRIEDREAGFDAAQQVALQPVGAGAEQFRLAVVAEPVHAAVLEEAADDRTHADVLRHARHARAQGAGAAHDQVDLHARLRGRVQRADHAAAR